jgi:hypothetical protein
MFPKIFTNGKLKIMPVLTASDAQQIRLQKSNVSHETYKILFETATQRVKNRAEMNETNMVFKVPHYLVGRPLFNVKHAARYVSEKLRIYGYTTSFYEDNGTYFVNVCWKATPVVIPKKPKDVRKPNKLNGNIQVVSGDAVRKMERIKLALENSMARKK